MFSRIKIILWASALAAATGVYLAVKTGLLSLPRPTALYLLTAGALFLTPAWVLYRRQKYTLLRLLTLWLTVSFPSVSLIAWGLYARGLTLAPIFDYTVTAFVLAVILRIFLFLREKIPAGKPTGFRKKEVAAALAISAVFLTLTLPGLGKQSLVDESYWVYERVEKYWDNVLEGDWKNTRINDKPGITVALFAGPALWSYDRTPSFKKAPLTPTDREDFLLAFRLPLLFAVALLLPVLFFALRAFFSFGETLFVSALIALSPPLLGISRLVNPDSLLWLFLSGALLYFLAYLRRGGRFFLLVGGILFGLALLTKYVANFLLVFLPMILFLSAMKKGLSEEKILLHLRRYFHAYIFFSLVALAVFILLFPGTWVRPHRILLGTIWSQAFGAPLWQIYLFGLGLLSVDLFWRRRSTVAAVLNHLRRYRVAITRAPLIFSAAMAIFLLADVLFFRRIPYGEVLRSPKTSPDHNPLFSVLAADYYALFFALTPLVLVGIVLAARRGQGSRARSDLLAPLAWFILLYYLGAVFGGVAAGTRYQITLYPLATVIGGVGLWSLAERLFRDRLKVFSAIIIVAALSSPLSVFPYYFSYSNFLLPSDLTTAWKGMGDGSWQAARYLNGLPEASQLFVWSDKKGVCAFFVGRCSGDVRVLRERLTQNSDREKIDYLVLSSDRRSRTVSIAGGSIRDLLRELYETPVEKTALTINPGKRPANFVKIIRPEP